MTGTMEGLSVPIFGEFYKYSEAQTQAWYVEDDGIFNISITSPGADNYLAVVVTDTSTVTTGYLQNVYASLTTSGSYTTANTQINAFAVDLTLGGTVGCEAEGMYVYVASTGSPTLTSANINGINVYIDDLGSSPNARSALQLHIADGNAGTGADAFIYMRIEGGSGAVTNMFEKGGTATNPTNFLKSNAANNMVATGDFITSATSTYGLKCLIAGTTYYIPLVVNS